MARAKSTHKKNEAEDLENVVIIKKYANRRLYNTATSSYVTLDFLAKMIRNGEQFVVYDAKSGDDITRSVLTQIIFEEESKGQNLLPIPFLRELIGYYGDNLQSFIPSYLEMSMDSFRQNSTTMQEAMSGSVTANPGLKIMEDMARQNMAFFEKSMGLFGLNETAMAMNPWMPSSGSKPDAEDIASLRAENAELSRQIGELKAALKQHSSKN
ncbi:MAG: polyhydroxyalkanoate synthesis repressor PhaR [bacterium]